MTARHWPRLSALALVLAAVGLPVNHLGPYALLVIAAILIFSGRLACNIRNWVVALIAVLVAALAPLALAPAPIEEGHNIFLPGKLGNVLEQGLPADVHRFMQSEFDAQYPPQQRCKAGAVSC